MKIILALILFLSGYIGAMESDEAIAKRALGIELSNVKEGESKEAKAFNSQASDQIKKGNYEKALRIITQGLETYPTNFDVQVYFATVLGDSAGEFPFILRKKWYKDRRRSLKG